MKKAIYLSIICAVMLSGCSSKDETAGDVTAPTADTSVSAMTTTTVASVTDISAEEKTPNDETTSAEFVSTIDAATESDVSSSESETEAVSVTTTTPQSSMTSEQKSEDITSGGHTSAQTTTKPSVSSAQTEATKSATVTTTKKQTATTTTAKKTTTTTLKNQKPAVTTTAKKTEQIVDLDKVSDQMWVFLEMYPIDYNGMYTAGKALKHDGTDIGKAKAVCSYAYNQGGINCIEYALNAYFLAQGAGLECYIARSSKYDWYGHVANIVKLDGKYYYMEPQGNIVGSPSTFAAGGTASDGSVISYPDGLDIVTDIYENRKSVKISDKWYE